jgi:ribosomal protein S18 acetylase RimI-like enzyme
VTNGELLIRTYEARDEASVTALWRGVFPDDPPWNDPKFVIPRKLATQPELFLVGELEGTVAATVVAGFDGFRGWIYHLAVAPEHRRKGFARVLMSEAEFRLRQLGCPKVNLQVRANNAEVIELYRHLGYQIEERVSFGKRLE